ncbi:MULTISPECIES: hypothetical protein [unclassified Streptomyces]|uniref:hypothetical protein n=1 Tax=Streptomyces sp. NBC_01500 TaxID=2903886 RepID=UPI002255AA5E|nr:MULTISPECIES: hypothetical protein [unclassified Streptomyces]MCX4552951.1 hypothetical protein [Streptomyces sp. NBC_01500]WSC24277.1 hypothetical protein OIE60_33890 [Streptomyces sp. NBC_01766]WSV58162.1 hypothetical protein OG282_33180 [Streptomyces sp. NBC_01014]
MAHHHKSQEAVEGNPDSSHGRGMPLRPDEVELEERTEEDRRAVDAPANPGTSTRGKAETQNDG